MKPELLIAGAIGLSAHFTSMDSGHFAEKAIVRAKGKKVRKKRGRAKTAKNSRRKNRT